MTQTTVSNLGAQVRIAVAYILVLLLTVSCARGRPFINSSLDFNQGRAHELVVKGRLDAVSDAVASIMTERGALLVKRRSPAHGSLVLSFRRNLERQTGSKTSSNASRALSGVMDKEETTNEYVEYGSLYYVELTSRMGEVEISAVGLPLVDGRTACPDLVRERYRDCKPAESSSLNSFVVEMEASRGIRADGAREADTVSGLLAELQRKKWVEEYAPAEE